jgi:hypothetical protein
VRARTRAKDGVSPTLLPRLLVALSAAPIRRSPELHAGVADGASADTPGQSGGEHSLGGGGFLTHHLSMPSEFADRYAPLVQRVARAAARASAAIAAAAAAEPAAADAIAAVTTSRAAGAPASPAAVVSAVATAVAEEWREAGIAAVDAILAFAPLVEAALAAAAAAAQDGGGAGVASAGGHGGGGGSESCGCRVIDRAPACSTVGTSHVACPASPPTAAAPEVGEHLPTPSSQPLPSSQGGTLRGQRGSRSVTYMGIARLAPTLTRLQPLHRRIDIKVFPPLSRARRILLRGSSAVVMISCH